MTYANDIVVEMIRMYVEDKKSIRAVAERFGASYGGVHRILKKAGVPLRPRGYRTWGGR